MSETPSEPVTGPVVTPPPAQPVVVDEPRRSKAPAIAAYVGIVAGVVFIVAVVFFSGFILGAHSGGYRGGPGGHGGHGGDHGSAVFRGGPPPMFPMQPGGGFERPGPGFGPPSGFGPGGPRFEPPQPGQTPSPGSTTAPPRP